jgi:hypothetical protein
MLHDLIFHGYGLPVLLFVLAAIFIRVLRRHSKIEKRITSQPNFTADDSLFSVSSRTGVAIDVGRKVLLLMNDRADRAYQARDLIGCEVLSDDVQLSGSPHAAVILRISVKDVDRPQHDVVLLERSFLAKMAIRGDDRVQGRFVKLRKSGVKG